VKWIMTEIEYGGHRLAEPGNRQKDRPDLAGYGSQLPPKS